MNSLIEFVHNNIDIDHIHKRTVNNCVLKTIKDTYQHTENSKFIEVFLYVVMHTLKKQGFVNGITIYSLILNDNIYKVSMERARDNLENFISNENTICELEKKSIVFQIFASIVKINDLFHFIHNDFHTRNIVYFETSEKHIHYNINNVSYTVPTFGKIFKIIDFGDCILQYDKKPYVSGDFASLGIYKNLDIPKILDNKNSCILINIIHFLRNLSLIKNDSSVVSNFICENQGSFTYIFQNNDYDIEYLYNNIHKYTYNIHYFNCFA